MEMVSFIYFLLRLNKKVKYTLAKKDKSLRIYTTVKSVNIVFMT